MSSIQPRPINLALDAISCTTEQVSFLGDIHHYLNMVDSAIYTHELTGRTIRLLTVELDEPSAPLRCKLSETCLDTNPTPYHALSYCLGPNQNPVQITCNSHPLPVTPNLHSALREYRRRGTRALLWVDAICINQSNTSERTSQVRMMDKIYTEAECVIVWLGEAQATDEQALEFLRVIHNYREDGDLDEYDNFDRDAYLVAQKCFDALAEFLLRPWFSRIWMYVLHKLFRACVWSQVLLTSPQCSGAFARPPCVNLVWSHYGG